MVAPLEGALPETAHYLGALDQLSTAFLEEKPRTITVPLSIFDTLDGVDFQHVQDIILGDPELRRDITEWTEGVYYCLNKAGKEHPEAQPLRESRAALKEDIDVARRANDYFPFKAYIQTIMAKTIGQHSRPVFEAAGKLPEDMPVVIVNKVQTAAHLLRRGWRPPGNSN